MHERRNVESMRVVGMNTRWWVGGGKNLETTALCSHHPTRSRRAKYWPFEGVLYWCRGGAPGVRFPAGRGSRANVCIKRAAASMDKLTADVT